MMPKDRDLRIGRRILYGIYFFIAIVLCGLTGIGIIRTLNAEPPPPIASQPAGTQR